MAYWQPYTTLRPYNTFGIDVQAQALAQVTAVEQIPRLVATAAGPLRVLGGGSNILLCTDIDAWVLHNRIPGITAEPLPNGNTLVAAGGGVVWHELVQWTLGAGLAGLENLSLIPGTVGAAPIQNIGAYGVELQDVFSHLEAIDLASGKMHVFRREDCAFGYRDSIFKREFRDRLLITRVYFQLHSSLFEVNTAYGAIAQQLNDWGITHPQARDVSRAVVYIRSTKLPDPAKVGNAGSFFKNPTIPNEQWLALRERFPQLPAYPTDSPERVKVPAGWLIEQAGWKGIRRGNAGVYPLQALVLVNYGGATGDEIWHLAQEVMASVNQAFGITLEPEVNIWGGKGKKI
ncbi:MAG: UDP-N-acetylmuramate dehydrogenase [Lewinellaceae bacterium]|nr:UDP-N-acetylmuramate dehydrogenase [Lewinellaceae bacterium]